MIQLIKQTYYISLGHYMAALEHCMQNDIQHKPTMLQSFITTIHDYIFFKTLYCSESESYVIYEKINKRTLGMKASLIVSMYTPIEHRGRGYISRLIDKIDGVVITSKGEPENEIGRLYTRRKVL